MAELAKRPPDDPNSLVGATLTGESVDGEPTAPFESKPDPLKTEMDRRQNIADSYAGIKATESAELESVSRATTNVAQTNAWRSHQAFNAEVATSRDIPSWNEQQQKEKFATDPVKAFGSIGSVFAMVAAAFSHRPMINALQGSAAAMDATREGNEKAYKDAYTAWKDNTELALKRHDMMRQEFQDAEKLGETDLAAAKQKQLEIALKFNDKKKVFLIQNGLDDDLNKSFEMENKSAEELRKHVNSIQEDTLANTAHESMIKQIDQAFEGRPKDDPQRIAITAEADRRYLDTLQGRKGTAMEDEQWRTIIQWELQHANDRDGQGPTAEERQKFLQGFNRYGAGAGGNTSLTNDRRIQAEVNAKVAEWRAEGKSEDQINDLAARETRRLRAESASPTAANQEKDLAHIQQFDNSLTKLESVTGVLNKYVGAAGLAGKATRAAERVRDIFGSKDTDRVQFMRDIEYLKSEAPQLLFDRAGRPLAAESDRINDIIGGLSAGDTTANTIRSLQEITKLYTKMREDAKNRMAGTTVLPESGKPSAASKPKPSPWQDDPEVK